MRTLFRLPLEARAARRRELRSAARQRLGGMLSPRGGYAILVDARVAHVRRRSLRTHMAFRLPGERGGAVKAPSPRCDRADRDCVVAGEFLSVAASCRTVPVMPPATSPASNWGLLCTAIASLTLLWALPSVAADAGADEEHGKAARRPPLPILVLPKSYVDEGPSGKSFTLVPAKDGS